MNCFKKWCSCLAGSVILIAMITRPSFSNQNYITPGRNIEISILDPGFPLVLHTLLTGEKATPTLTFRLPDGYDTTQKYPLLVYIPGGDGGLKGNIFNAQTIAGSNSWIVATMPLFKKMVDKSEPAGGLIVSVEDYPVISQCYKIMLGELFKTVPNINYDESAMVGFSNGAITLAILLSAHDEFILNHFKKYCMVDHGMFHLTDLHKKRSRDCHYLVLVGDKQDLGRELKIKRSMLLQEEMQLIHVNLRFEIMKNTGHEFRKMQMAIVREWLLNGFVTQ